MSGRIHRSNHSGDPTLADVLIGILLGVVAFCGTYFGLQLWVVWCILIAIACALFGVLFIVIVLDGDGDPW